MGLFGKRKKAKEDAEAKMAEIKKVAIISASMDILDPENEDHIEQQKELLAMGMEKLAEELSGDFDFEVVPPEELKGNEAFDSVLNFPESVRAGEAAGEAAAEGDLAVSGGLGGIKDLFQQAMQNPEMLKDQEALAAAAGEGVAGKTLEILQESAGKLAEYGVGVDGFPLIPYGLFDLEAIPTESGVNFGSSKDNEAAVAEVAAAGISEICEALEVDGVVVMYVRSLIEQVGDITLVDEDTDRSGATIRMNGAAVLISKEGELLGKLDYPKLDDLSPFRPGVLVYNGMGEDKTLDLRHEKPADALNDLIEKCARKISNKLRRDVF